MFHWYSNHWNSREKLEAETRSDRSGSKASRTHPVGFMLPPDGGPAAVVLLCQRRLLVKHGEGEPELWALSHVLRILRSTCLLSPCFTKHSPSEAWHLNGSFVPLSVVPTCSARHA